MFLVIHIKQRKQFGVLVFFLLIVPCMFLCGCQEQTPPITGEDFKFTSLDGETHYLSEYQGSVVLLDLMAYNCVYCWQQMVVLKQIHENYSGALTLLSIDVWVASSGETAQDVHLLIDTFQQQYNIELNWMFGLDDVKGTIEKKYASSGIPVLYLFDSNGNVYYSHIGLTDYTTLTTKIDELLG